MSVDVKEDNTEEFDREFKDAISRALEKVGLTAERYAKALTPVDTGRLRNSITHQVINGENVAVIGTNVEYAPYVELGTSRQEAQPYLVPAAENHLDEWRSILESELKGK